MDAKPNDAISNRALPALLSQVLVAFTVEADNEFARRMDAAGFSGAGLSLVVWLNVMRFLAGEPISISQLSALALSTPEQMSHQLACLERWRFVTLRPTADDLRPVPQRVHRLAGRALRDGWGSGRGMRAEWQVHLTGRGRAAMTAWQTLIRDVEKRWLARFGKAQINRLCRILTSIIEQSEIDLPWGFPAGMAIKEENTYPPRTNREKTSLPLPVLLAQVLLAFSLEFGHESSVSLALCSNVLRVLGEKPVRVADLPRLTGLAPEQCAIGWLLKPLVAEEPGSAGKRGTVARLKPAGLKAHQTHARLVSEIEARWQKRFGAEQIRGLRQTLLELFVQRAGNGSLLAAGMVPPAGVVRARGEAPSLGRKKLAAAARQRGHDLVVQTQEFIRDPASALPHFPQWDMNRGFGP